MGDEFKKAKKGFKQVGRTSGKSALMGFDPEVNRAIEKPFSTGKSAKAREQRSILREQQQREGARLAEADSEIAERKSKAFGKSAGRKSLIRPSAGGLSTNLGGTA